MYTVRFGTAAVSERLQTPPPSAIIQVTLSNGLTRVVRPSDARRDPKSTALQTILDTPVTGKKAPLPAMTRLLRKPPGRP